MLCYVMLTADLNKLNPQSIRGKFNIALEELGWEKEDGLDTVWLKNIKKLTRDLALEEAENKVKGVFDQLDIRDFKVGIHAGQVRPRFIVPSTRRKKITVERFNKIMNEALE